VKHFWWECKFNLHVEAYLVIVECFVKLIWWESNRVESYSLAPILAFSFSLKRNIAMNAYVKLFWWECKFNLHVEAYLVTVAFCFVTCDAYLVRMQYSMI
jgi:hypothetical protein